MIVCTSIASARKDFQALCEIEAVIYVSQLFLCHERARDSTIDEYAGVFFFVNIVESSAAFIFLHSVSATGLNKAQLESVSSES